MPLTRTLIGAPLKETLFALCPNPDEALVAQLTAAFKAHYDTIGFKQTHPFPGVRAMLDVLSSRGGGIHIATNKRAQPTAQILKELGWTPLFGRVISPDSCIPHLETKAGILARLLADEGLNAGDSLYVGDRREDFLSARENGLNFALAEWGFEESETDWDPGILRLKFPDAEPLFSWVVKHL